MVRRPNSRRAGPWAGTRQKIGGDLAFLSLDDLADPAISAPLWGQARGDRVRETVSGHRLTGGRGADHVRWALASGRRRGPLVTLHDRRRAELGETRHMWIDRPSSRLAHLPSSRDVRRNAPTAGRLAGGAPRGRRIQGWRRQRSAQQHPCPVTRSGRGGQRRELKARVWSLVRPRRDRRFRAVVV